MGPQLESQRYVIAPQNTQAKRAAVARLAARGV
jgi:hypothetical protein